jgi:hypothetical protein
MKTLTNLLLVLMLGLGPQVLAGDVPDQDVLDLALSGYNRAVAAGEIPPSSLLTIIDYSKPSTESRLFIANPATGDILHTSLVAHGKNSGLNIATRFGNEQGSLLSSLGFFRTGETYFGRHGYSLRLHGLEPGINDNALERDIVVHGADYVSKTFVAENGRLGRSWGCPALPVESTREVIDLIKGGTGVFIFGNDSTYLENSVYIEPESS